MKISHAEPKKDPLEKYLPSFQAQAVPNNFIQLYAEMSTVTS